MCVYVRTFLCMHVWTCEGVLMIACVVLVGYWMFVNGRFFFLERMLHKVSHLSSLLEEISSSCESWAAQQEDAQRAVAMSSVNEVEADSNVVEASASATVGVGCSQESNHSEFSELSAGLESFLESAETQGSQPSTSTPSASWIPQESPLESLLQRHGFLDYGTTATAPWSVPSLPCVRCIVLETTLRPIPHRPQRLEQVPGCVF